MNLYALNSAKIIASPTHYGAILRTENDGNKQKIKIIKI